jgi:hypothetical protein
MLDTRFTLTASAEGFEVVDTLGEFPAEYAGERRRTGNALADHRNGGHPISTGKASALVSAHFCPACRVDSGRYADPGSLLLAG